LQQHHQWFGIGIDALFTGFPDTAHAAREQFFDSAQ
jgi:hypothetical protein